eukprot:1535021-Rhodomonas_salina.1
MSGGTKLSLQDAKELTLFKACEGRQPSLPANNVRFVRVRTDAATMANIALNEPGASQRLTAVQAECAGDIGKFFMLVRVSQDSPHSFPTPDSSTSHHRQRL